MNEWISVKDRLPTEAGNYLVNIHYEDIERDVYEDVVLDAWYNPYPCKIFPGYAGWHLLNEFYSFTEGWRENITHWIPWPEPPEATS